MASFSPSSVKSEPTGPLYESNLSYTSLFDTSIENTLESQTDANPRTTSAIYIDAPASPSNETPFELLQGVSAPTLPVYINMGLNEHTDDVNFAGTRQTTTTHPQLSRSLASVVVDHHHPSTSAGVQRQIHHQHHFPHHAQNRNRYPYIQKSISSKVHRGAQDSRTSLDSLTYYEQRPAFRRSYFALRRQRIPKGIVEIKFVFIKNILFSSTNAKTFISWL
jgi:hypothetical protein